MSPIDLFFELDLYGSVVLKNLSIVRRCLFNIFTSHHHIADTVRLCLCIYMSGDLTYYRQVCAIDCVFLRHGSNATDVSIAQTEYLSNGIDLV